MITWHKVDFELPVLGSMSDEDLGRQMPGRDGRWSSPIKAAMVRLKTDKLDLDENWASRPPVWTCPACGRDKADLLRLSDAGVLLARLDQHHDHLTDLLKRKMVDRFGARWPNFIPEGTGHVESLGSMLVARFEPSVVCIDCNAVDAKVKARHRDVPRLFSFRPSEIARLVSVGAGRDHCVDFELAYGIFLSEKENFERRAALVETLFDQIVAGTLTREPGNSSANEHGAPLKLHRIVHSAFIRADSKCCQRISRDLDAFVARSVSRDGVASNARKKAVSPIALPSAKDVTDHDGGGAPALWRAAGDGWKCPGCHRSRAEILRRSKKPGRPYSGKLVRHTEYSFYKIDEDADADTKPMIARHAYHLICSDCAFVMTGIKQRNPDISISRARFQISDFAADAIVAPNQAHDVQWDLAAARARASIAIAPAIDAYERHKSNASLARIRYTRNLERNGGDARLAWERLVAFYRHEWSDQDDVEDDLAFLLEEADRIDIPDPFQTVIKEG